MGFPASTSSDRPTPVLPAEERAELDIPAEVPADAEDDALVGDAEDDEDPEVGLLVMWLFYIPPSSYGRRVYRAVVFARSPGHS